MKLLFDIDDIACNTTQTLLVDYTNKISNDKGIFVCNESIVKYSSLREELMAYAPIALADIISRIKFYSEFCALIGAFDWHCLFRSPEPDVEVNGKDKYTEALMDSFDAQMIENPKKIKRIPIKSSYEPRKLKDFIFDENYDLITSSEELCELALGCDNVRHIIMVLKIHNISFCSEILNAENSKIIVSSDVLSAFQTYASILNISKANEQPEDNRAEQEANTIENR